MPSAYQIVTLKVELAHTHIPIWRRLDVNAGTTLRQLHHILQIAMGWENVHLYDFQCGDEIYDDPRARGNMGFFARPQGDDRKITVGEITARRKSFLYHYDSGDSWTHKIKVERNRMADSPLHHAVLRGGQSACPPEDCGGPSGYAHLLHILEYSTDPDEQEWFESIADCHGPFEPHNLDERAVNAALARMVVRGKDNA